MKALRLIGFGIATGAIVALFALGRDHYQLRRQVAQLSTQYAELVTLTKDYTAIREEAMCAHAAAVAAGWGNHGRAEGKQPGK